MDAEYACGTEVEEGKSCLWCAGDKSQKQPVGDGSHEDTEFLPLIYTAEAAKTL